MTTDGRYHYVTFGREDQHPLAQRDPRNQYVNFNNKFVDEESQPKAYAFNKTKRFFRTEYDGNYSPPRVNKYRGGLRIQPPCRDTVPLIR